jgi:hypothetical protein
MEQAVQHNIRPGRGNGRRMALLAIVVAVTSPALAQIGMSREEVMRKPGAKRVYLGSGSAVQDAYRVDPPQGESLSTTYVLRDGKVSEIRWFSTVDVSVDAARAHIRNVTGLPRLVATRKRNAEEWPIDLGQARVYPPLGAWQMRSYGRVFRFPNGFQYRWTEYYDLWGRFLGSDKFQKEPHYETYTLYLGEAPFSATKQLLPFVRRDQQAYALIESSSSSDRPVGLTREFRIAEPASYFESRSAELKSLQRLHDDSSKTVTGSRRNTMSKLRPYHLEPADDYERTVLDFVPLDLVGPILDTWQAQTLVVATDNPLTEPAVLEALRVDSPVQASIAALNPQMMNFKYLTPEARLRRARMLDALGSTDWIIPVVNMLNDKDTRDDAKALLMELGARRATSPEDLTALGTDVAAWRKWYQAQIKSAKR